MTARQRDYLALAVLTLVGLAVVWHFWPVLMAVEGH